jgi:pimeloyl-ACP methyl ester carboxylesterase
MEFRHSGEFAEVDGLKTFYLRKGTGHPLLLIHGGAPGASTFVSWRRNIDCLAGAGFAVYGYDQPGFGYTDNPSDFSMEYRCQHAKSFIDSMELDRFHIIANSQGAYIGARIALEDPRTASLVFTASGTLAPRGSAAADAQAGRHAEELRDYVPSLDNIRSMTMKTLFHKHLVDEDLVRLRYEMSIGKNYEAQQARKKVPPQRSIEDQLPSLRSRTLLLWGKNDAGVAVERGVLLFQALPNAELHIFNECGHWCQWDQTTRFHSIVTAFLNEAHPARS